MGLKKRVAHVSSVERMYESLRQKSGQSPSSVLHDAAACIFWKQSDDGEDMQVYLAQRAPTMKFLGSLWAFVGGGKKENESVEECCLREVHEELGLVVDASRLVPAARWQTPDVSPIRFDARYFLVELSRGETPDFNKSDGELVDGRFFTPNEALELNRQGELILPSPVWRVLKALDGKSMPCIQSIESAAKDEAAEDTAWFITPDVSMAPLRTPTLPPATHTNAYFLGHKDVFIVDPGSPYPEENKKLIAGIKRLGLVPKAVLLTHHHADHIGGADAISNYFGIPVWASKETKALVKKTVKVDREICDGEVLKIGDAEFEVILTPGHAKGHCCFLSRRSKFLVAGDMVAGLGTIYIDPDEGDMGEYIASLGMLRALNVNAIGPAHGSPIANPNEKLDEYISHRLARESSIFKSISESSKTVEAIVEGVYMHTPRFLWAFAARQTQSHLNKLVKEGKVKEISNTWRAIAL